jgi:hypothetical protein
MIFRVQRRRGRRAWRPAGRGSMIEERAGSAGVPPALGFFGPFRARMAAGPCLPNGSVPFGIVAASRRTVRRPPEVFSGSSRTVGRRAPAWSFASRTVRNPKGESPSPAERFGAPWTASQPLAEPFGDLLKFLTEPAERFGNVLRNGPSRPEQFGIRRANARRLRNGTGSRCRNRSLSPNRAATS